MWCESNLLKLITEQTSGSYKGKCDYLIRNTYFNEIKLLQDFSNLYCHLSGNYPSS